MQLRYIPVALMVWIVSVDRIRAAESDWPSWRGPERDGRVQGIPPPAKWPAELRRVWSMEVGAGHASPVVAAGVIYQFSRLADRETLSAIDLSGKLRWRKDYPAPYEMNNAAVGHGKGPKATPAVSGDRIFTLGVSGILTAWRLDGEALWRHEFGGEFPKTSPLYGAAASPLVAGRQVIVPVGGHDRGALRSFHAAEGKVAWSFGPDGPAYTSPILAKLAGVEQLITQTQNACVGISLQGELLWTIPFTTDYDQNSITPVVHQDLVIVSGYNHGVTAYRPVKQNDRWSLEEVWHNDDAAFYMSSPVITDGRLYGFSHFRKGQLVCLDAAMGKTHWMGEGRQGANAALLALSDMLAMLTTNSRLTIFRDAGDGADILAAYTVADSPTWAHPTFVPGGVLIKDAVTLSLWSWK